MTESPGLLGRVPDSRVPDKDFDDAAAEIFLRRAAIRKSERVIHAVWTFLSRFVSSGDSI
jgi:hypothetical protein